MSSRSLIHNSSSDRIMRRVLWIVLFGVAFGYLEAAVVVYLRNLYDPIRASLYPDQPADSMFPLITPQQLHELGDPHIRIWIIEIGREFATLVMLAALATLAARRPGEWLAMFLISFGMWDIVFYVALRFMIGFPASLWTWDLLFLIPVPWAGPVIAPLIVALTMIVAGLVILRQVGRGRVPQYGWWGWGAIFLGAGIIVLSFCRDHAHFTSGGVPQTFRWILFTSGEVIAVCGFVRGLRQGRVP